MVEVKPNLTPPPAVEAKPNSHFVLPFVAVLSLISFVLWQILQTMPPSPDTPLSNSTEAKYGSNRKADWVPTPFQAPNADSSRSPCPMLNTLANHGYLPHDGQNIDEDVLSRALGHVGVSNGVINALVGGIKLVGQPKPDGDGYVMSLSDLGKHGIIEHDVSLSRFDYRPDISPDRHVRPSLALIRQLESFADANGFLGYSAVARARNLRLRECQEETREHPSDLPEAKVEFGLRAQGISNAESSVLLEVIGRAGRVHISAIESFFAKERFPEDWSPPADPIGLPTVLYSTVKSFLLRVLPGNGISAAQLEDARKKLLEEKDVKHDTKGDAKRDTKRDTKGDTKGDAKHDTKSDAKSDTKSDKDDVKTHTEDRVEL